MSSLYDPADDTINTILAGLLPALILGLFNGFEEDKKSKRSFINVFDDIIIFGSIIAFPLYTLFTYNNNFIKNYYTVLYIIIALIGIIIYPLFLYRDKIKDKIKDKMRERIRKLERLDVGLPYLLISIFTISLFPGYYLTYNDYYCVENFGSTRCRILEIMCPTVVGFGFFVLSFYLLVSIITITIKDKMNHSIIVVFRLIKKIYKFIKWFHIMLLIFLPGFASGYLLSNNSRTTKIAFAISTIAFTRLVNHFGDKPGTINTMISFYLNGRDELNAEKLAKVIIKIVNDPMISKTKIVEFRKQIDKTKIQIKMTNDGKENEEKIKIEIEMEDQKNEINLKREFIIEGKLNEITTEMTSKDLEEFISDQFNIIEKLKNMIKQA